MSFPLRVARRAYRAVSPGEQGPPAPDDLMTGQAASDLIRERLAGDASTMVARFGSTELVCVLNYLAIERRASTIRKSIDYVSGRDEPFWWHPNTTHSMCIASGFFPPDPVLLARYAELTLADLTQLDVLGSWLPGERLLADRLTKVEKVHLRDLVPYYHGEPWSEVLAGRTVLVIHPFEQSIRDQYARRRELFADPRVLPDFELKTLRAVQSIAGTRTPFVDWFEAFDHMCEQISTTDFDVAIIGCGAYGFPLAAHVKRLGKHAVHLGGATQYLFGIRGKAADENPKMRALYTDAWVRPRDDERPENYLAVEQGRYW
jgi:hypothetical protein